MQKAVHVECTKRYPQASHASCPREHLDDHTRALLLSWDSHLSASPPVTQAPALSALQITREIPAAADVCRRGACSLPQPPASHAPSVQLKFNSSAGTPPPMTPAHPAQLQHPRTSSSKTLLTTHERTPPTTIPGAPAPLQHALSDANRTWLRVTTLSAHLPPRYQARQRHCSAT